MIVFPWLLMGATLAAVGVVVVVMRLRMGRLADALGAEVTWRGLLGQRRGQPFRYCAGGKNQRPRLSIVDVPVSHELRALARKATCGFGVRSGLEREVAGIEPAFDAEVAVFSADEEFARALFSKPETRRLVTELVQGTRDRLAIGEQRVALEIGRGPGFGTSCRSPERLSAGVDRLIELVPHVEHAAGRAPEPVTTWRRWMRRNMPWAMPIAMALLVAAGVLLQAWMTRGG